MLQLDLTPDELKTFLDEAREHLDRLEDGIVRLEAEPDEELLREVFRAAHTLKGSSGMIGYEQMSGLTHAVEDVLDRLRKRALVEVTPELTDLLLAAVDRIRVLVEAVPSGGREVAGTEALAARLSALALAAAATEALEPGPAAGALAGRDVARVKAALAGKRPLLEVRVAIADASAMPAARCYQAYQRLLQLGDVVRSIPAIGELESGAPGGRLWAVVATKASMARVRASLRTIEEVESLSVKRVREVESLEGPAVDGQAPKEPDEAGPAAVKGGSGESASVRVDVRRMDALLNLVGELTAGRTRVMRLSGLLRERYKDDELVDALGETSGHITKAVSDLHDSAMRLRMLPIGVLFRQLPRLVRDLARDTGKRVSLEIEGEDTELDRSLIERLRDPLVHLTRNAVYHGIEGAGERAAAGKPETGCVRLRARQHEGAMEITLQDDGAGLDVAAIARSAIERGVAPEDEILGLSDREIEGLIFAPGVSTAAQADEVSGRGVGLDIVRQQVEAMSGVVMVDSAPGVGSTFTLRLPLTLGSFKALLVKSEGTTYAIPLTQVREAVRAGGKSMFRVMGRDVLSLRGATLPVFKIGRALGDGAGQEALKGSEDIVVAQMGEKPVALAVDAVIQHQDIVVKPLSVDGGRESGVSGGAILADGQVALVLDVAALIRLNPGTGTAALRGGVG
ncbi:MAG: chemotaxis protein CheA [Dehalococcoidia bacterium]